MSHQRKMRPEFYALHAVTLTPATTVEELAAALRATEGVQDRHRLSEGAVYASGCRRYLLETGRAWRAETVDAATTSWAESDHRLRLRGRETTEGDYWTWACSCGETGAEVTAAGAQAEHAAHLDQLVRA